MTRLPPPAELARRPADLVTELAGLIGAGEAARVCAELLEGADAHDYAPVLPYLAGRAAQGLIDGTWAPYWGRVWGSRGLRYVWRSDAEPAVVGGVSDEHWRVAEMCLKVAAMRELPGAADGAVALLGHDLPRVRMAAVRTLGLVGDTEHVAAVIASIDDGELEVRKAALRALRMMHRRLDLGTDIPDL